MTTRSRTAACLTLAGTLLAFALASTAILGSRDVAAARGGSDEPVVQLVDRPDERRVDVLVGGQPFTSYLHPATLEKPVLYPIRSARGVIVTRGYPLEPRAGEPADHPHHVGHWFNFGDVNGFDFWGHSSATPASQRPKMGSIVHTATVRASSGAGRGELLVRADWRLPDASVLLREDTRFVFAGGPSRRAIDRETTWTAAGRAVTFNDTKEGAFGIRVARGLELPSTKPGAGGTGRYFGSDGTTGEAVWGTRGPWMALTGTVEGAPVTLAILDHPSNHGAPTYWHARGYGLFAANPFGRHAFDPKQPTATFTLQPGQSMTFRHRILVNDGVLSADDLRREHTAFAR